MEHKEAYAYIDANHELILEFKNNVDENASTVDPADCEDWHSLTIGWALGKGLTIEDSHKFAAFIRYFTELG